MSVVQSFGMQIVCIGLILFELCVSEKKKEEESKKKVRRRKKNKIEIFTFNFLNCEEK